jgi:hypothetical protein
LIENVKGLKTFLELILKPSPKSKSFW